MNRFAGPSKGISSLVSVLIGGGALTYAGYNSLFTVEGGHRAVMYNRVVGVKDQVRNNPHTLTSRSDAFVYGIVIGF